MLIKNSLVFYNGKFEKKELRIANGRFECIEPPGTLVGLAGEEILDAEGKYILPGLVDIHSHGRAGADFSFSEAESLERMLSSYAATGVTSVLATTMTNAPEAVKSSAAAIRAYCEKNKELPQGARAGLLGIHMEGPFLCAGKKGAHDPRYLLAPDIGFYEEIQELSGGRVRLVAIAPELFGAEKLVRRCKKDGVTVSLAHTECNYELACEAASWGADHVTHAFNAMQPLHHREPGLIGAALDKELYVELICDGIHVHPSVIRMLFKLCPDKVLLISDSMPAAGLPDGEYGFGGSRVFVKDKKVTQADGTIAGSVISVYEAMVNAIRFGVPAEQAVLSAAYLPAKSVGMEQEAGSIEAGHKADFLIADENWRLCDVYIAGERVNRQNEIDIKGKT